ncbi:hypothetical protein SAMN04487949_3447 [Halogranum gelatinilyticum]|uniref:Uncharacterized protein n=1 Tax=Halogranum gelatinilyticum TaxID=660521 RepID=A0A1G9YXC4_9EURY|nr:hypothetical protein [Halogranum gelatinilyticum]SDN13812.1 hypothetical protein SAMN04487949_3447 [Halogranum gelatinilyticum]
MATSVTVACADCPYTEVYDSLRVARTALDEHEQATGHRVDWQIGRLSTGVERAGSDAGVCGLDDCNPESPLVHDWDE